MGQKVTWSKAAAAFFADSFKWRLDNTSDKGAIKFADEVDKAVARLATYPTSGKPAQSDPALKQANVGYNLYVVYEIMLYGIHIHTMRSHRQGS